MAVDSPWWANVLNGLDTGAGIPEIAMGHLQRIDDDVSAGFRLAHPYAGAGGVERMATAALRI